MLSLVGRLRRNGVTGLNRRNADFVLPYNPRRFYPLVDDKLLTKRLAEDAGISVPALYGVIEIERQVRDLARHLDGHDDFVIKPARGSRGDGIVVISGRLGYGYRKASGNPVDIAELQHHVSSILGGMYSLGGQPDKAMIEYRVRFDPVFEAISFIGVPDVRIIVFLGVPVMAMVRLPTRISDGKANLHQGAVGAGVDIAKGKTLKAVWFNDVIGEHPDTGNPVSGIAIPQWPQLLKLASRCYRLTGLGYQGVDIVLDRDKGPLILELNARPGLNIQIANQVGLLHRLKAVELNRENLNDTASCVDFAVRHFAA
jgi:alpha-L-glutamate ligase-like protein